MPKPQAATTAVMVAIQSALRMMFSSFSSESCLSRRGRGRFRRETAGVALQFYPCVIRLCRLLTISLHRLRGLFGGVEGSIPQGKPKAKALGYQPLDSGVLERPQG